MQENNPRPLEQENFYSRRAVDRALKRAARSYNKLTGAGTDAFHPRVLLDFRDETCPTVADCVHVIEVIGK